MMMMKTEWANKPNKTKWNQIKPYQTNYMATTDTCWLL